MTWVLEYDAGADETAVYWNGSKLKVIDGKITQFKRGVPVGKGRKVIEDLIKNAETSKRVSMLYDLHFGFERREVKNL